MLYKKAYLCLFNRVTDIIKMLEKLDPNTEQIDTLPLLKAIQAEAEGVCIEKST